MGELAPSPPALVLRLNDGREVPSVDRAVMTGESPHHRATVVRFASTAPDGARVISDTASFF